MRAPVSLCDPQNLNQSVDFHEIGQEGHAIQGDLDAIICNTMLSTGIKLWRYKLKIWAQNLHQSALHNSS
jgi:hypothetical protein